MPYDAASGQIGVFTLEVTQTANPIWFFCARKPHCKGGMYGAINPPTTGAKTFAAFAASVPASEEPGFGVTAPFTPTTGNSTASGSASVPAATPSSGSTGTTTPNGAGSVSARGGVALFVAGLAASLML